MDGKVPPQREVRKMQAMRIVLLFAALLCGDMAAAAASDYVRTQNVGARLLSESRGVKPGQVLHMALQLDIRDGWHTYWKNPGDSGRATQIAWQLPQGFTAEPIQWTTPHRFDIPPLVNYGYDKQALHLIDIAVPAKLEGREITLVANADWLVCADLCIPESARLELKLPVGDASVDPSVAPLFAAARAALPEQALGPLSAQSRGNSIALIFGDAWGDALQHVEQLEFFGSGEGQIEYAAPQTLRRSGQSFELLIRSGYQPPRVTLAGVLVIHKAGAPRPTAFDVSASLAGVAAAGARFAPASEVKSALESTARATVDIPKPAEPAGQAAARASMASLLLLALAGGLILNLMPCVFPVLSIKAMSLVEQAKKSPAAVRAKGIVFAAGVIASMLTLAGVLLALRSGGQQLGWGFQLQSPWFVTMMAYLLFAVGLNLSGVFELGSSLAGVGDSLARGEGLRASFFTGVLTTLVATPCTAPFMAAAVGAALTQPPLAALSIFVALGAGLSLPFLALSFAPVLRRMLPKPGAWMETLKQLFAFPMYASAAWLVWVLAQQTSPEGLGAVFAGLVLIALVAWLWQRAHSSRGVLRAVALGAALVCAVLALALPARMGGAVSSPSRADSEWQNYDPARLATLVAAGKPVLVNFTASWCLTCLINERNAFADPQVKQVFERAGVTLIKGDWTNRDPAITNALAEFGRAGVPLYVAYNAAGARGSQVLPQLLSASLVRDTFTPQR